MYEMDDLKGALAMIERESAANSRSESTRWGPPSPCSLVQQHGRILYTIGDLDVALDAALEIYTRSNKVCEKAYGYNHHYTKLTRDAVTTNLEKQIKKSLKYNIIE